MRIKEIPLLINVFSSFCFSFYGSVFFFKKSSPIEIESLLQAELVKKSKRAE